MNEMNEASTNNSTPTKLKSQHRCRGLPLSSATLRSALHRGGADPGLRDDVGVITAHQVALSNLSLLLLQHCVQVLITCTTMCHLSTGVSPVTGAWVTCDRCLGDM